MRDPIDMGALLDRALAIADYHAKRARFDADQPVAPRQQGHRARDVHARRRLHRLGRGPPGLGRRRRSRRRRPRARAVVEHRDRPGHQHDLRADRRRRARRADRRDRDRAARHVDRARQRSDRGVAHLHGRREARRDRGARARQPSCKKVGFVDGGGPATSSGARARGYTSSARPAARHRPLPGRRRACAGTTRRIRAMPTARTRGRSTWPRSRSTPTTWETRVDDFVAVQEVGKVINPVLAAGQIEGGVAQAIGWALYERVVWREGRMANGEMTNYIMPTSMDLPPIRVFFEEQPYAYGPAGAKGIGELPMDGPAPAIINAVAHATGADPRAIPMTPEVLMALMETRACLTCRRSPSRAASTAAGRAARPPDGPPARRPAPRAAAHRHEGRLRRGRVRRLLGARRRRAREQLPRAAAARRRDVDHDDRGRRHGRAAARRAGGVHRARRRAVRHLHAGHGARRGDAPRADTRAVARRHPHRARRQPVPVHRLHADLRSRASGVPGRQGTGDEVVSPALRSARARQPHRRARDPRARAGSSGARSPAARISWSCSKPGSCPPAGI